MNEEIDETEFYQQDFTTASDWEIFISRIEEIINQWERDELKEESNNNSIWKKRSEKLVFVDVEFELLYYELLETPGLLFGDTNKEYDKYKIENSVDINYDFSLFDESLCHPHSCIFSWYGLKKYFVLTTTGNTEINSESKIKVLLSSLTIAVSNLNCQIPAFVQIREKWQQLYLGVHQNEKFRTNFSMVHLSRTPSDCMHPTNLINLFFSKLQLSKIKHTVLCAVQFIYLLTDFGDSAWKQYSFTLENENLDVKSLYRLPFGATADPIESVKLKATWKKNDHSFVGDTTRSTAYILQQAKKWSISIKDTKIPICLLSDCFNEYVNGLRNNSTIQDILNELRLDSLVETKVSAISSILGRAARNSLSGTQKMTSAISEDILIAILYYLFPDADNTRSGPSYPYDITGKKEHDRPEAMYLEKECKGFKTCPPDSLLWRFCIISACLLNSSGGFRAFAQIWNEFVQEMRYRWEKNIFIPGLTMDLPDLRTCLLHQKLQMLNCCIERKKKREESPRDQDFDSAEGSSSDEEFFDCADKPEEECRKVIPTGRLGKFQTLKLIETGESLYIPITQEPAPKTEDQLDEDADVLLKLGSDAQGSEMRAKLMSASLLSDMEAFKAANPGSILDDFIRWYSPRDWTEIDEEDQWGQKKGELSKRMLIEDNIWAQTWKTAKPVPANKQKLLFDDTREAEKILHYLESRTLQQVIELFIPILLQVSIHRLAEEIVPLGVELPDGLDRLRDLIKLAERTTRDGNFSQVKTDAIVHEMAQLELVASEANSLNYKLIPADCSTEDTRKMIRDLLRGKEVEIDKQSEIGQHLKKTFDKAVGPTRRPKLDLEEGKTESDSQTPAYENSPTPLVREFVLSVNTRRPEHHSSTSPQYLRAILSNDGSMRLAGAFSEDICFF